MADNHISSCVIIPHKYCISLKNTNSADKINPSPRLKIIRHTVGKIKHKNFHVNGMPSKATKPKKTSNVKPKFIKEDTFCENKKRYFGTFTLVKIDALLTSEFIPKLVASEKYENTSCPANK